MFSIVIDLNVCNIYEVIDLISIIVRGSCVVSYVSKYMITHKGWDCKEDRELLKCDDPLDIVI